MKKQNKNKAKRTRRACPNCKQIKYLSVNMELCYECRTLRIKPEVTRALKVLKREALQRNWDIEKLVEEKLNDKEYDESE